MQSNKKQNGWIGKKLIRGTPTGVLISIALHAILFIVAASWVVIHIEKRNAEKFTPPPPIKRAPIPLKKPQVKRDKTPPRKAPSRISSKNLLSPTTINLPSLTSSGTGLGQVGGFEMISDLKSMTLFGGDKSTGNDLVGTFYDLKRDRAGAPIPGMETSSSDTKFGQAIRKFLANDWSPAAFDTFWRSSKRLYATQVLVPICKSKIAPPKFGVSPSIEPSRWVIHYNGKISYKEPIKFRFVGFGDDILIVGFNKKVVLNACYGTRELFSDPSKWRSSSIDNRKAILGNGHARVGDWITLEPGVPGDLDVLIGEFPGGGFCALLLVQVEGVDYPKNDRGTPILPMFKTAEPPQHIIDEMDYSLVEGECSLTNGPVFNTY